MVEVFKTNVQEAEQAVQLIDLLRLHFPNTKINFDLDDCDKVLRIEGKGILSGNVMQVLKQRGFMCNVLD